MFFMFKKYTKSIYFENIDDPDVPEDIRTALEGGK